MRISARAQWRRWKLNVVQAGLLLLVLVFAVATVLVPSLVARGHAAIEHTRRQNVGWIGLRAIQELQYAEIAVLTCGRDLSDSSKCDDAQVAADVLAARVDTWGHGEFGDYVDEDAGRTRLRQQLRDAVPRLEAAVATLDMPDGVTHAMKVLETMREPIEEIAAQSYTFAYRAFEESNAILAEVQNTQHILLLGLLGCGFVLVALFAYQNRLLQRAYAAERKVAEEQAHLAKHDALTGLAKREAFREHLKTLTGERVAVLAIDLDGFKPINDLFGHLAGDGVLVSVAERLRAAIGANPGDLASRFGGDEFFVVLADADLTTAECVANRILDDLRRPHAYDGHLLTVNATIGIAVSDAADEDIVRNADLALNHAKGSGKNRVQAYEPDMGEAIDRRRQLEAELEGAAARGEFVPWYQPTIDLATGRIVGVEALARWRHPTRGVLEPADFLTVAESSGQIVEIGRAILEHACRDAVDFPEPIGVSVNLSAVQWLRSDIPATIAACLARTGLPASRLMFDMAETAMLRDEARYRDMINRLSDMGIAVALDNFGTGHSSLAYLSARGFDFDAIKIDRSVVAKMRERHTLPVLRGLAGLSRQLGLRLVALGVETEDQARLLMEVGCDIGQGFFYHRPMPAADLAALLRARAHAPEQALKAVAAE